MDGCRVGKGYGTAKGDNLHTGSSRYGRVIVGASVPTRLVKARVFGMPVGFSQSRLTSTATVSWRNPGRVREHSQCGVFLLPSFGSAGTRVGYSAQGRFLVICEGWTADVQPSQPVWPTDYDEKGHGVVREDVRQQKRIE